MSVTPQEPVVFGTALEALLERTLGGRLSPETLKALKELKVEPGRLKVAYDVHTWMAVTDLLRRTVYPNLGEDEAMERLGQDFVRGLGQTLVGKGIFALLKLQGPRRSLQRMTQNSRASNNYIESRLEEGSDGVLRLHYSVVESLLPAMRKVRPPSPYYFRGIVLMALELSGGKDIDVRIESNDPERRHVVYRVAFNGK